MWSMTLNLTPLAHGIYANNANAVAVAKELLSHGAEVRNLGYPALVLYAAKGNDEVVKLFLQNGADVNARAEDGKTALIDAAKWGHCSTAALLLANRAEPALQDNKGRTAKDLGGACVEVFKATS
jgi:ankyrin repeat protein